MAYNDMYSVGSKLNPGSRLISKLIAANVTNDSIVLHIRYYFLVNFGFTLLSLHVFVTITVYFNTL